MRKRSTALSQFIDRARKHGSNPVYVPTALKYCTHVFLRKDVATGALEPPYTGPHEVLERNDKTAVIRINERKTRVSLDRIKPAHVLNEAEPRYAVKEEETTRRNQPRRRVRFKEKYPR